MLRIEPILAFHDNYIWMISHSQSTQAIIVDPGESQRVLSILEQRHLSLAGILITHHHYDHTNGIAAIIQKFPAPVYGPAHDFVTQCDHPLQENDTIHFPTLSLTFHVIDIPGHTLGHIAFVTERAVFCGDTLFTAGCGRIFEGTHAQLFNSLTKLTALPDDTNIFCGHEYTKANLSFANIVEPDNIDIQQRMLDVSEKRVRNLPTVPAMLSLEKRTNPFLRCAENTVIKAAEKHAGHTLSNSVDVFRVIRQWKNHYQTS